MVFFQDITKKWPVLWALARREIRQQYIGSTLGIVWQVITPLVLICVFWVVFSLGFRVQPESGVPFAVWLTAGFAAWFAFSEMVSGSVHCITGNPHLVKKVVFPIQALPIVKILVAASNHILFLLILMALMIFQNIPITAFAFQGLYYFVCMVILGLGLGWVIAALNVFSRDTARLVGVALQVGMWGTPVLWDLKILPEPYQTWFSYNPMHYIVQGYRDSFLYSTPVSARVDETILFWVITGAIFLLGIAIFKRLKPQFADLV